MSWPAFFGLLLAAGAFGAVLHVFLGLYAWALLLVAAVVCVLFDIEREGPR